MEQLTKPVDWVGEEHLGFVINAAFSPENTETITAWLAGLQEAVGEGIYTMKPEGLHITVLDWIAPLVSYDGVDKRALYKELYPEYDTALRNVTNGMQPFDVHFNELRVTPGAIILVGQDGGQFQSLRKQFTDRVELPKGGKQPPSIIHGSLVRFVAPEIALAPIEEYARNNPLDITQHIDSFRLVETRREPMQDFDVLDTYSLNGLQ